MSNTETTGSDDEPRAAHIDAEHGAVLQPVYGDPEASVEHLAMTGRREKLRRLEAMLFASAEPLDARSLAEHLEADDDVEALLVALQADYEHRGVTLHKIAGKWQFRTADDLSFLLERQQSQQRRLSKAALETMSIIAYHQPVTRAEIEDIRGVSTSSGTLDVLMETGWIKPRGRRRAPGRPLTYGTTEAFLTHFGLDTIKDLPGLSDLKAAGLLDGNLPPGFSVPEPTDVAALMPDELPLSDDGDDEDDAMMQGALALEDDDESIDDVDMEDHAAADLKDTETDAGADDDKAEADGGESDDAIEGGVRHSS